MISIKCDSITCINQLLGCCTIQLFGECYYISTDCHIYMPYICIYSYIYINYWQITNMFKDYANMTGFLYQNYISYHVYGNISVGNCSIY